MKRIAILVTLSLLLLVACGQTQTTVVRVTNVKPASQQQANQTQTAQAQQPASNETQQQTQANVTGAASLGDIEIDDAGTYTDTIYPQPGDTFGLKLKVVNKGTTTVNSFEYEVQITDQNNNLVKDDRQTYNSPLAPNGNNEFDLSYSLQSVGTYTLTIKIDPSNVLHEPAGANVEKEITIYVLAPTSTSGSSSSTTTHTTTSSNASGACTDSDGGKNYNVAGTCTSSINAPQGIPDLCLDKRTLWEQYCAPDNSCQQETYACPGVCVSGACT